VAALPPRPPRASRAALRKELHRALAAEVLRLGGECGLGRALPLLGVRWVAPATGLAVVSAPRESRTLVHAALTALRRTGDGELAVCVVRVAGSARTCLAAAGARLRDADPEGAEAELALLSSAIT